MESSETRMRRFVYCVQCGTKAVDGEEVKFFFGNLPYSQDNQFLSKSCADQIFVDTKQFSFKTMWLQSVL